MDDLLWKNIVLDEKLYKDIVIDYLDIKFHTVQILCLLFFMKWMDILKTMVEVFNFNFGYGEIYRYIKKYKGMWNKIIYNSKTWNNSSEYFGNKKLKKTELILMMIYLQ